MGSKIVTITGASGSGKTTLVRKCQKMFQRQVAEVVSVTTRPPRRYEVDAIDYYFVSEEDFKDIDFLETTEFNGYHYGTDRNSISRLMKNHKVVFAIVDHNGAKAIKDKFGDNAISVFLHSSRSAAYSRVRHRDGEETAKEREIADVKYGIVDSEKTMDYDLVLSANNTRKSIMRKFLDFLGEHTDLDISYEWKLNFGLV